MRLHKTIQEMTQLPQADAAQAAINQEKAKSKNLFVTEWRQFIGWVCGAAFACHYVIQPFAAFVFSAYGVEVELPDFDMETLHMVLFGILGLGGLRTVEKIRTRGK
jgi:hypothetical protein